LSYSYDAQGQQRVATVQDGQTAIATARDAEGRVTSISEGAGNAGPYVSSFTYNANDLLQAFTLPGGVQESAQYDPNSQLTGVTALGPNTNGAFTTLTSQYGYTYDAANRVNSTRTLSGTDSLAYDGASRRSSETEQTGHQIIATGGAHGWTYDNNGNIQTAIDDTGPTDLYTYSTTIRDELMQLGGQVATAHGPRPTAHGPRPTGGSRSIRDALHYTIESAHVQNRSASCTIALESWEPSGQWRPPEPSRNH